MLLELDFKIILVAESEGRLVRQPSAQLVRKRRGGKGGVRVGAEG